jgi:hypothetical protein
MAQDLGRLVQVDPRDVWPHEAYDFTPWLLGNEDVLSAVLGIDLELTAAEHPVGGYALDLVGRDLTNDCVLIVENQLTVTDHSHLGQLLTYAAGTDAKTVVWMAPSFREEHRQALDYLNDLGGEEVRFFGVEFSVVRIGTSVPAPLLRLRAQPNDWHASVSASIRNANRRGGKAPLYEAFWTRFLDRVRKEHPRWTNAQKPQADNWFSMPGPLRGCTYSISFSQGGRLRNELYVDSGDAEHNLVIFNAFLANRESIEARYGGELSWEELPTRRACRIASYTPGDVTNEGDVERHIDWFFDAGTRLRSAVDAALPLVRALL